MGMYSDTEANRDDADRDANLLEDALARTLALIDFFNDTKKKIHGDDARDVFDCLKDKLHEAIEDSYLADVVEEIDAERDRWERERERPRSFSWMHQREPIPYGPMS